MPIHNRKRIHNRKPVHNRYHFVRLFGESAATRSLAVGWFGERGDEYVDNIVHHGSAQLVLGRRIDVGEAILNLAIRDKSSIPLSFCQLNFRGCTPLCQLTSGVYPFVS